MQAKVLGAFVLWAAVAPTLGLPSVASPQHSLSPPRTPVPTYLEDASSPSATLSTSSIVLENREHATHRRRTLLDRQGLRMFYAEHVREIIPAQLAVPGLKLFYSALIAFVEREWRFEAPLKDVVLNLGNLQLQMSSVTPIAWDFVTRFSRKMLTTADLGFTGTYNMMYADQAMGQLVTITLRVIDHETGLEVRSNAPKDYQAALSSSTLAIPHVETYGSYNTGQSLYKRVDFTKELKATFHDIKAIIMPVGLAVQMTKAFYESVMEKAFDEQWKPSPSSSLFTITEGVFELTVSCLGGAVPMETLHHFGEKMIDFAAKGWLPIYDVYYREELTGAMVAVAFRIKDGAFTLLPFSKPSRRSLSASPEMKKAPVLHRRALNRISYSPKPKPRSLAGFPRNRPFSILSRRGAIPQVSTHLLPIRFHHLTLIAPVNIAAPFLEDFYDSIALRIETGFWNAVSPLHFITFRRWNFQLSFYSYAEAVPWDFIQNFVIEMSEYAAKGFTSSYEATFGATKATGAVFVSVTLRLLDGAAAIMPPDT